MSREQVLALAQKEHNGIARVVDAPPQDTPKNVGKIFIFGIYWLDCNPSIVCPTQKYAISYGPRTETDTGKEYVCYAS